jgi:PhzF family phenazine biosynthesis protein
MPTPIYVVDAFASAPFRGNPAGVVIAEQPLAPALMRGIAAEMKHSETAFAVRQDDAWSLRWLTPVAEVDLCGHATLATSHVLWETGRVKTSEAIRFSTRSGVLVARNVDGMTIELDFPALVPVVFAAPFDLAPALGVPVLETWRSRDDMLVLTGGERAVREAKPDLRLLATLPVRGLVLTAACEDRTVDFVSRFFAPAVGVDEDPVTGSAHCALAPFWAARLGKTKMRASQLSERRGDLEVELVGDRVLLRGRAVTILRGELAV